MNSFNAIGRIGKDAQTRYTQGGRSVTGWSLAVDTGWGDKKQTLWFDCSMWGERGEKLAPMLLKGDRLAITGEIGSREYEGKTIFTVDVKEVTLLGTKGQDKPNKPAGKPAPTNSGDPLDDDIPF